MAPKSDSDRFNAARPLDANLIIGQGPVEGAEPEMVGQASSSLGDRVPPVHVEQVDRLEQVAAGTPERSQHAAGRNAFRHHEGEVDVGRGEPADRTGILRLAEHH